MFAHASARGFALLETLAAATLVAGVIATLLALLMQAADQSVRSESETMALMLAQAKLEDLRSRDFAGLAASPDDALRVDVAPFFDSLDRFGNVIETDAVPEYRRRWAITSFDGDPDVLALAVCVAASHGRPPVCVWTVTAGRP